MVQESMSNSDPWHDFEQVRHSIRNNTVERLKQIVAGFNEECGLHMAKSGKKQELIDRIVDGLDQWRRTNNEDRWAKAKAIIAQVRNMGQYIPPNRVGIGISQPVSASHVAYDPPKPNLYSPSVSGSSSIGHYDPYAPPRRPAPAVNSPVASSSSVTAAINHKLPIRFKESPFFSVEQAVSGVLECPESTSATDRRVSTFTFSLTNDQLSKMKSPGSKYQLRLFCTSSLFYAGFSTFRTNPLPCPVEFPPTCEVRINTNPVLANLKGLKKKPGTAPPPDISALARLSGSNKVDMVYVNSQQPVQSKKFYIIVMLVEATSTEAIVAKLQTQNYRSSEGIQEKMRQMMNEDEDIVAGPQKMSLKCPLTFVRITNPCRSERCVHPQCFDATSWFTMMEMTTTWLCPVCERALDHKDLIIDGYFDAILKATPDSVEDVVVEADGEWHTADNGYASAKWKAAHSPKISAPPTQAMHAFPLQPVNCSSQVNGKGKEADVEILVLDSDEEEERPESPPSYASSSGTSFDAIREPTLPLALLPPGPALHQQRNKTVIDLTLDDSDDDQHPVSNNFGKRKASDANLADSLPDQLWKRGRLDSSRILPTPHPSASIIPGLRPQLNSHPSSPSNLRYPPFANNTLPQQPVFPVYNRNASGSSSPLQLPPISAFSPRQPTASHHPGWA